MLYTETKCNKVFFILLCAVGQLLQPVRTACIEQLARRARTTRLPNRKPDESHAVVCTQPFSASSRTKTCDRQRMLRTLQSSSEYV